jgi:hypothetical protein
MRKADVAKQLVFTNLKPAVTEAMIRNFLFNQGEIRSISVTAPQDRQQGYAYIEMALDKDAARVMRRLNHHQILGQQVSISRI